jgi:hypothetical protein
LTIFEGAVDETKDGEYLAFVICDIQTISKNLEVFPSGFKHLSDISYTNAQRKKIIDKLDLNGNLSACCIKFDIPLILKYIRFDAPKRVSSKRSYQKISYRMKSALNTIFTPFLIRNQKIIQDISFQVDNNLIRSLLTPAGFKCTKPSGLHKIADCIAYANLKKWDLKTLKVVEKGDDFSTDFFEKIKKDLYK